MKELRESFMVWKMAILKAFLTASTGAATTWVTSMSGLQWSDLSGTNRAIVITGALVTAGNTIVAFLDRSISRIEKGQPLSEEGKQE